MSATRLLERRESKRLVGWALLISLLIHLVIVLTVATFYILDPTPPPEQIEEIEITIIDPPPQQKPTFVDTSAPESNPPEQAPFESDRNTVAASPDAATGEAELPSQDGKDQPFMELDQQELAMAKPEEAPPAPEVPPSQPAPPVPSQPDQPEEKKSDDKEQQAETDALLALAKPQPDSKEKKDSSPPPAPPPSRPSYQRQARPTRLSGSVSNRGKAAVASMATPLGRYRKAISDAIGSSWYYHIGHRMDLFTYGTVSVVFTIDRNGKARRPRVLSNTSNESFEIVTLESILAAEIPPIPPDILPTLDGGQIEIDYTFSIITQ
jgi:outer membrane biosynthesis protein TonB